MCELFGESGGLVDGLDDDPFVPGAAERLSLDELAGEPVTDHAGAVAARPAGGSRGAVPSARLPRMPEIAAMTQEACGVGVCRSRSRTVMLDPAAVSTALVPVSAALGTCAAWRPKEASAPAAWTACSSWPRMVRQPAGGGIGGPGLAGRSRQGSRSSSGSSGFQPAVSRRPAGNGRGAGEAGRRRSRYDCTTAASDARPAVALRTVPAGSPGAAAAARTLAGQRR